MSGAKKKTGATGAIEVKWTAFAIEKLMGKTVTRVRYLSDEEAEQMGWHSRPLVIEFSGAFNEGRRGEDYPPIAYVFASSDDEGNNGGALFGGSYKTGRDWTFPVLRKGD